ncbi:hypothetical protein BR93DRAFT_967359 [Coniochaeta sp. PMI_546]|nr:hypothetical protein BR93DRAFT_967359 [Coniochaeta sp. PMI_546]
MPKAKRKSAPDGNELSEVQWAPISTVTRAPMMPQPPPLPPMTPGAPPPNPSSAFHSVSSEGPSTPGAVASDRGDNMLRASDLRVQPPVLPSNGPTDHHHHYIPTPTSSGRATPTNIHPGTGNPLQISNNYSTANPSHGRPFPGHDQPGPHSSHILPSIERPESSNGRHTPVAGSQPPPPPPEPNPFRFSKYSQPPPPPMLPPMHQSPLTHHHHHHHSPPRPENPHPPTSSAQPHQQRSLSDDEVRRLQRFMSLNWRVGVINHPPFARRNNHHGPAPNPEHGRRAAEDGPQIAGFVGSQGSLGQAGGQRPR